MLSGLNAAGIVVNLIDGDIESTRCRTCYQHLVTNREGVGLNGKLCHAQLRKVFYTLTDVLFALRGIRTVVRVPFTQELSLIIAIPETTVEDGSQALIPLVLLLFRKGAFKYALDSLLIALYDSEHIFRSAGSALYLKHTHTSLHHLIDKANRLQVLGRHDIFVVNLQFCACLAIGDDVATATYLHTGTAIGRTTRIVKAHIALTTHRHTQRAMAEHLNTHQIATGSLDLPFFYLTIDLCYLLHLQLTSQYDDISKLRIKLQCLNIRDIELRREMDLHTPLTTVSHHGYVAGYHC